MSDPRGFAPSVGPENEWSTSVVCALATEDNAQIDTHTAARNMQPTRARKVPAVDCPSSAQPPISRPSRSPSLWNSSEPRQFLWSGVPLISSAGQRVVLQELSLAAFDAGAAVREDVAALAQRIRLGAVVVVPELPHDAAAPDGSE